jgi:Zn-dependent protease
MFHELGHALVALRYGLSIDSITLWLFGGVAQLATQPEEWRHELSIALAGPVVSIALGVFSYLLMLVLPSHLDPGRFLFGFWR